MAGESGAELICASTNLGEFLRYFHPGWDIYAGSLLACIGLCLEPYLSRIHVPSGDTYSTLSPWGSHPLTDPLWGTERLEFFHHGCEASRSEKIERVVAHWPLALAHLRVCGSGLDAALNCGHCEKCLRSAVALEACGALSRCSTLPALDYRLVAGLNATERAVRFYLHDNLALARRRRGHPRLEAALLLALRPPWPRRGRLLAASLLRRIDQRWLGGALRRRALAFVASPASAADLRADPGRWLARQLRSAWR